MKEYIIYFGRFELPDKNALAHRVKANAMAMKKIGYHPILVGYSRDCAPAWKSNALKNENIEFYEVPYPGNAVGWLKDYKTYKKIEKIVLERGPESIKSIICTGVGPGNIAGLLKMSKKFKIPMVYDVVDWFDYDKRAFVFRLYKTAENFIVRNILEPKIQNYICISSFLGNHYYKEGRNIAVIPSLTFSEDIRFSVGSSYVSGDTVTICYAGSPGYKGSKDRIDWVVKAFDEINKPNSRLAVFGMKKEDFIAQFPELDYIKDNPAVCFYGRRPNQECIKTIFESDFFAFARIVNRMTTAGFPTKYSESAALHTPVITTPTSDLRQYIVNNENGFIAEECSFEAFKSAMESALSTTKEERTEMHKLQSKLDICFWEPKIKDFLDELRIDRRNSKNF